MNLKFLTGQFDLREEAHDLSNEAEGSEIESEGLEEGSEESGDNEMEEASDDSEESSESDSELVENSEAETEDELKEEIQDAIDEGASEEEIKQMIKKFELKVNGKVKEVEIDLSDEEAVKRELQKSMAFSEKAKEAKELKSTYEQALKELMTNPIAALAELGIDVDELASGHIMKKIEDEQKTPEQKEAERQQQELAEAKRKLAEYEASQKRLEEERRAEEAKKTIQAEIDDAWDKTGVVIPKNPKFISRVADALDWAETQVDEITGEKLFPNVSIADVLPLVEEEYFKEMNEFIENTPEDYLEKYGVARATKKKVEKSTAKKPAPNNVSNLQKDTAKAKQVKKASSEKKQVQKQSSSDFFRNLLLDHADVEEYE